MRRYFFNVHGERSAPDQVDEELPNNEAAWHEATLIAGELFKEIDGNFRPGQEWSLEVTDAQGILSTSSVSAPKRFKG
jgi:hypothetical protein